VVFYRCASLVSVTFGNKVTSIGTSLSEGGGVFSYCASLTGVYFKGNAPKGIYGFYNNNTAIVYYLPSAKGWSNTFAGRPTALWNPQAQTGDGHFGAQSNQFGFTITGTTNIPLVVEACTNLTGPVWTPLQTCTLTNGSMYFRDPQWSNSPCRFYRFRSP
jgi:hypothetical protein